MKARDEALTILIVALIAFAGGIIIEALLLSPSTPQVTPTPLPISYVNPVPVMTGISPHDPVVGDWRLRAYDGSILDVWLNVTSNGDLTTELCKGGESWRESIPNIALFYAGNGEYGLMNSSSHVVMRYPYLKLSGGDLVMYDPYQGMYNTTDPLSKFQKVA